MHTSVYNLVPFFFFLSSSFFFVVFVVVIVCSPKLDTFPTDCMSIKTHTSVYNLFTFFLSSFLFFLGGGGGGGVFSLFDCLFCSTSSLFSSCFFFFFLFFSFFVYFSSLFPLPYCRFFFFTLSTLLSKGTWLFRYRQRSKGVKSWMHPFDTSPKVQWFECYVRDAVVDKRQVEFMDRDTTWAKTVAKTVYGRQ